MGICVEEIVCLPFFCFLGFETGVVDESFPVSGEYDGIALDARRANNSVMYDERFHFEFDRDTPGKIFKVLYRHARIRR